MNDYISREAMSETPKCPGCGADMELVNLCNAAFCYVCKCGWDSPVGIDSESAFRVAMRRAEPKNRVLTLEEVAQSEAMWYDDRLRTRAQVVILGRGRCEPDFTKLVGPWGYEFYRKNVFYNDFWRCWLRKPTEAEMRETPWEGDSHE